MNPRPHPTTFATITPRFRARLEAEIERLIALLDTLDGDSDFESSNDDEPSLGWTWSFEGVPVPPAADGGDDRERDDADDEEGGDLEPSIGWTSTYDGVPVPPAAANCDDREADGDEELSDIEALV